MIPLIRSESFPAVATAAPVCFVIGGVWFSPLLFGKARMGELRVTGEPSRSPGAILAIPASLAPSFRLGVILASAKVTELPPSLLVAGIVWACFTVAIELPGLVLERAPLKLAIGVDHKLLVYLGFAPVFALWTWFTFGSRALSRFPTLGGVTRAHHKVRATRWWVPLRASWCAAGWGQGSVKASAS